MKRNIIGGAFTLASLMLAGHALAEDGVVHFVGEIVDTTCEVTSDTADQIVPLGKVSKNAFSGVGSLASPQKFSIKLENCSPIIRRLNFITTLLIPLSMLKARLK